MSVVQINYYNGSSYTEIYPQSNFKYFLGRYTGTGETGTITINLPDYIKNNSTGPYCIGLTVASDNSSYRIKLILPLTYNVVLSEGLIFTYYITSEENITIKRYETISTGTKSIRISNTSGIMNTLNHDFKYIIYYFLPTTN